MVDDVYNFLTVGVIGLCGWFFGGLDGFFKVLLACTVVDYITGLSAAYVKGEISSAIGFKGIARKVVIFSFVGIAHVIDKYVLGDTAALRTAVCLFYVGNEGISIIENAEKLGVPIPKFLHGKFKNFTEGVNDEQRDGEHGEANAAKKRKHGDKPDQKDA